MMRTAFVFFIVLLTLLISPFAAEIAGGSAQDAVPEQQDLPDPEVSGPAVTEEQIERVSFLMDAGSLYAAEGEFEEAMQAYFRALDVLPRNPDIRFRLSTLYIQMKNYREAAHLLREMIVEFPDNPLLHNNLAWVYATGQSVKNGALALHHAREAILLAPVQPSMWNTLAEAYFVSGQYEQAMRASAHAFDLLQSQQNTSEQDVENFRAQYEKIRRAAEAYKRFMGIDE